MCPVTQHQEKKNSTRMWQIWQKKQNSLGIKNKTPKKLKSSLHSPKVDQSQKLDKFDKKFKICLATDARIIEAIGIKGLQIIKG